MRWKISILILTFAVVLCGDSMAASAPPMGQSEVDLPDEPAVIGADIFGKKGGTLHPFLLFEHQYTDNLYNTNTNEDEDFITTVSPGLWVALPGNREKLLEIGLSTSSPGGLNLSRIKPEGTRRAQGYLLYAPEFVVYSNNSEHNATNHRAEGMFQYNFNMGLSIDLIDQFNQRSEVNDNGIEKGINEYRDNLLDYIMIYDTSEKFRLRFDYSNYDLNYDDTINNYMDRNDNSISAYVFYRVKPKTSVFVEYEFSDISFDTNSDSDSVENRFYVGVEWDATAKTRGRVKVGYIDKDFDSSGVDDQDGFSFEIQSQHNFTPKRALRVTGFRRFNESSMINASTYLTTGISTAWLQRFTEKWSGTLALGFSNDQYREETTFNGITDERDDDLFTFSPAVRYDFRKWMSFDLGYVFARRNSNFSFFEYDNNTLFFRIDLSI